MTDVTSVKGQHVATTAAMMIRAGIWSFQRRPYLETHTWGCGVGRVVVSAKYLLGASLQPERSFDSLPMSGYRRRSKAPVARVDSQESIEGVGATD